MNKIVPMVIQDANTLKVLSMFYANKESIKKMKETGFVYRYSRSKKRIMKKGEESGNIQKVVKIIEDCDNDAILVLVNPFGPACHTGTDSCFTGSILEKLEAIIGDRKKIPRKGSYTNKILTEDELLKGKLREELEEFINFKDKENLKWEAADLIYFMMVFLAKNGITFSDVEKELKKRMI